MGSDGNRVNFGNSADGGVDVYDNWDDNRNDNLGLASARKLSQVKSKRSPEKGERLLYKPFVDFIHPPSIRPTSSVLS